MPQYTPTPENPMGIPNMLGPINDRSEVERYNTVDHSNVTNVQFTTRGYVVDEFVYDKGWEYLDNGQIRDFQNVYDGQTREFFGHRDNVPYDPYQNNDPADLLAGVDFFPWQGNGADYGGFAGGDGGYGGSWGGWGGNGWDAGGIGGGTDWAGNDWQNSSLENTWQAAELFGYA